MSGYGEIDVVLPAFAASALSFVFIAFLYMKINAYPTGVNIDMDARGNPGPKGTLVDELSKQVRDGSIKFLTVEYTYLAVFVLALAGTLFGLFYATESSLIATSVSVSFVSGATLSASAGWWGMMVATDGNRKTTSACAGCERYNKKATLNDGLEVAFTTGAVMGFAVVGLGLLGVSTCFLILSSLEFEGETEAVNKKTMQCLAGFGFGASSIALFARVAGGIYTKVPFRRPPPPPSAPHAATHARSRPPPPTPAGGRRRRRSRRQGRGGHRRGRPAQPGGDRRQRRRQRRRRGWHGR